MGNDLGNTDKIIALKMIALPWWKQRLLLRRSSFERRKKINSMIHELISIQPKAKFLRVTDIQALINSTIDRDKLSTKSNDLDAIVDSTAFNSHCINIVKGNISVRPAVACFLKKNIVLNK